MCYSPTDLRLSSSSDGTDKVMRHEREHICRIKYRLDFHVLNWRTIQLR